MQINQYPVEATSVNPKDLTDFDVETSPGVYQSQKVTFSTLMNSIANLLPTLYSSNGTLTSPRTVDQDGNKLNFKNGTFHIGNTNLSLTSWSLIVNGNGVSTGGILALGSSVGVNAQGGSSGVSGSSGAGFGITGGTTSGVGVYGGFLPSPAPASTALAGKFQGSVLIEEHLGTGTKDPSALVDIQSTEKGVLHPRMTEAQMLAITSPADYLEVINTTRGIKMYYDPFFGWTPVGTVLPYWGFESIEECNAVDNGYWRYQHDGAAPVPGQGVALGGSALAPIVEHNLRMLQSTDVPNLIQFKTSACPYDPSNQSMIVGGITELNSFNPALLSGIFFIVDSFGVFTYSDYVQICCSRDGDYLRTLLDTTVLVSSLTPDTSFEIRTNTHTKIADFYIDDVLVGSINTDYPMYKTLYWGTYGYDPSGYGVLLRYSHFKQKFITPR